MIDRGHELPLGRQAELLGLSRGTLYYEPRPVPPAELAIMRRIDELHLDYPFAGSRMLRDLLRGEGVEIGRELVATLMRRMGIEAIYRPAGPLVAAVDRDGRRFLPRSCGRSTRLLRAAGDFQFRPRFAVHQCGVHRAAPREHDRC